MNKPQHLRNSSSRVSLRLIKLSLLALSLCLVLVFGSFTLPSGAWLNATDDAIVNTVTGGQLDISIAGGTSIQLIPGNTASLTTTQRPRVTVPANSIKCYVFAEVSEIEYGGHNYIDHSIPSGWTQYSSTTTAASSTVPNKTVTTYYYCIANVNTTAQTFYILNSSMNINSNLGLEHTSVIDGTTNRVAVVCDACAVQFDGISIDDAFTIAKKAMA